MKDAKIYELLVKIRPVINASALESAAGLPKNTLGKHYRWVDGLPYGQKISSIHYSSLLTTLYHYFGGFPIDYEN